MAYAEGVDIGSTQTRAVIVEDDRKMMALLEHEQIGHVVGAGRGGYRVTLGDTHITEIGCRGVRRRGQSEKAQ